MHAANKARTDLFHLTGGRSVTDILSICLKTLSLNHTPINSLLYSGYEIEKGSNKSVKTPIGVFVKTKTKSRSDN